MALFSVKKGKKKEKEGSKKPAGLSAGPARQVGKTSYSAVLVRPRITEKASAQAESNVYVFEVMDNATKKEIAKAVSLFYKVIPEKIRVSRLPRKSILVRGREGMKSGVKKAYVYLKEGDKIEFV